MPAKAGIQSWVPAFAGTNGSNGHASSPVFFNGAGYAVNLPRSRGVSLCPPPKSEGNGAPSGAPSVFPPCGGRASCACSFEQKTRSPLGAPSRRSPSGAGPRFRLGSWRAGGFPLRSAEPTTVSELLAGGRSTPGRSPGVQNPVALVGYEINPTACHLNIKARRGWPGQARP